MGFVWLLYIGLGFLSGSVLYSRALPRLLCGRDVCALAEDKNPGAYNVFVHSGWKLGLLCLFLDMLKAYAPVRAAMGRLGWESLWFSLMMAAPVLGHALAPFDRARGGKCIAAAFGTLLALIPVSYLALALAGLYVLTSAVLRVNSHRRRTVVTFAAFALLALPASAAAGLYAAGAGCLAVSGIVILRHLRPLPQVREEARERRHGLP